MTMSRDCELGFDLARDLKIDLLERVPQPPSGALLHCFCWLLADMITKAEIGNDMAVGDALEKTVLVLTSYVARLHLANAEAEADLAATKH